jgi:lambda family phage tail tape measure protein
MMGMLARLGVVLGLDSAEFQKGIEGADRSLAKFAHNAQQAATLASAAFVAMTYKALSYGDAISDTAKANEVAVASILALSKGLAQNGGNADNATKLISSFTAKVGEAAQGSLGAQQAFGRLGVSLNDLAKLSPDKLFDKTLYSIAALQDPITRNAAAMEMFGRAAKGVDFVGLASGTQVARDKFKAYAAAVEEAGRLHDALSAKAGQTMLMFTNAVIPTLGKLFDHWTKNSAAQKFFFDQLENYVKYSAVGINTLVSAVAQLADTLVFMGSSLAKVLSGDFKGISAAYDELKAKNQATWADNQKLMQSIFHPEENAPSGVAGTGRTVTAAKDPNAAKALALDHQIGLAERLSAEYIRQNKLALDQVTTRAEIAVYAQREQKVRMDVLNVEQQLSNQIAQVELKILDARIMGNEKLAVVLEQQRNIIQDQGRMYVEQTESTIRNIQAQQYSFTFGWEKSFNQFNDDAMNYSKMGENAFSMFTNTIGSAIDQFAENGTKSFGKFTLSIIADIAKMITKFYAMQLAMMAVGFITSAFGGGGMGKGGSMKGGFMPSGMTGTGFAAEGGEIGGPTIVGEKGPELFIPSGRGNVIPNNRLSDALSPSGQPSIVYNGPYIAQMSAIDTQSALQFLSKNKMGVWAANQSANKSVPVNR